MATIEQPTEPDTGSDVIKKDKGNVTLLNQSSADLSDSEIAAIQAAANAAVDAASQGDIGMTDVKTAANNNNITQKDNNDNNDSINNNNSKDDKDSKDRKKKSKEPRRGWWHSATREDCIKAEENMVKGFVDLKLISYESRDIEIDFDSRPQRLIEKEKKKSHSSLYNLLGWSTNDTNANNNDNDKSKNKGKSGIICRSVNQTNEDDDDNNNDNGNNQNDSANNETTKAKIETENKEENAENNKKDSKDSKDSKDRTNGKDKTQASSKCSFHHSKDKKKQKPTEIMHSLTFKLIDIDTNNNNDNNSDEKVKEVNNDTNNESDDIHIVIAHGYGCAGCIFVPSINHVFENLINNFGTEFVSKYIKVHLIDWLGCGLSSKPNFLCEDADETETFFIESFEKWRAGMNITKMILVGHSVGGYCSTAYSLKYGQYVSHLILLSPAGIPECPPESENEQNVKQHYPWQALMLFGFIKRNNVTPFDIVRFIGPKGPKMVEKLVGARFARSPHLNGTKFIEKLTPLLANYLYQITHTQGSGEYCLNKILTYHAYGVKGLYSRFKDLNKYGFAIDFVYGEYDWMDSSPAFKLKKDKIIDCNIYEIEHAGHQLAVENKEYFAKVFANVIKNGQKWKNLNDNSNSNTNSNNNNV